MQKWKKYEIFNVVVRRWQLQNIVIRCEEGSHLADVVVEDDGDFKRLEFDVMK